MKKWVQHISGQGDKWEVWEACGRDKATEWAVDDKNGTGCHFIPTSEYVECPPPEQFDNVTNEFNEYDITFHPRIPTDRYRLRKVGVEWFSGGHLGEARRGVAFIVERRKS